MVRKIAHSLWMDPGAMLLRRIGAAALVLALVLGGCVSSAGRAAPSPTPEAAPPLRISGSGTALPLVQKLAELYRSSHPEVLFQFGLGTNSGGAIRGVLDGTLDLAVANRPLTESEAAEPLEYYPFALDAVVFAAHRAVPVQGLTTSQIRDVFGGSITDWRQLGVAPGSIKVLDRDEDESARKLVLLPLMDGRPVQARTVVLTTARDMLAALESTEDSLGYTSLGLLKIQPPRRVQVLALDGVTVNAASLASGAYPWVLAFSLIARGDAPSAVHRFVDFVTGQRRRRVLEEYGYAAPRP